MHTDRLTFNLFSVGFRLGLYLFIRITKERDDRRFNLIRHNVKAFIIYYIIQGRYSAAGYVM